MTAPVSRRSIALVALLGFAAPPARAWQGGRPATLREELMALEKERWEYLKARDRAGMRRVLAGDAVLILADGRRYATSELLSYMPDYRLDCYDIDPDCTLRSVSADVASLVYRVTSRGAERGDRARTARIMASSLYVRRAGEWRNVLYQETSIK
jgi:hypothetical protein